MINITSKIIFSVITIIFVQLAQFCHIYHHKYYEIKNITTNSITNYLIELFKK